MPTGAAIISLSQDKQMGPNSVHYFNSAMKEILMEWTSSLHFLRDGDSFGDADIINQFNQRRLSPYISN